MTAPRLLVPCGDCGMPCAPDEYHPFAACLMFKACHNSNTVRINLDSVVKHGHDAHHAALAAMAKRLEAAERDAARYRWLRYAANISWNDWVTYENLMASEQERAEMDAAIDRAMEIAPILPPDAATQEGEG